VTAPAQTALVAPEAPAQIAGPEPMAYVDDAEPFDDATQAILATKVNPEVVEVRAPNDLLYVPWIHYQTILVQAFGVGGFRMVPKRPARQQGNVFTWEGSLWVRPKGSKKFQFVDEAVGECGIQSAGNGPEGAKSDCLTKCCKRLNIFMELFDPAWRRWWEGNYKGTHQAAKGKRAWVERGRAGAAESHSAPSSNAPTAAPSGRTTAPAADAPDSDTGEAASDESKAAIRAEVKRRKWTPSYARLWLQQHFGQTSLDALTQQQAAQALVKVMSMTAPPAEATP
jgi:hypothetical protein